MSDEVRNEEAVNTEDNSDQKELVDLETDGLAKGDSPDFKWYVAHVLSGFENRVTKTLKERILNHNMGEMFSDILVPEESVLTSVNGKKRKVKRKFFPGYVLIKMIMNEQTWHLVKDTDKITDFLGGVKGQPTPISDDEANYMLGQTEGSINKPRSSIEYVAGDSVKVIEGPFASFVGTVEAVSANGKLKVNVSIFGRPTPVELDDTQVEKA